MKKMKKQTMAFFVIGTILILGTGLVLAHQSNIKSYGIDNSENRHEMMQKAFDTMDYDLWVKEMSENSHSSMMLDIVTKENFDVFAKSHNAMMDGDFDKSRDIRKSIGLLDEEDMMDNMNRHMGRNQMRYNEDCQNH